MLENDPLAAEGLATSDASVVVSRRFDVGVNDDDDAERLSPSSLSSPTEEQTTWTKDNIQIIDLGSNPLQKLCQ